MPAAGWVLKDAICLELEWVPRGTRPWWRQVLTSRHKGLFARSTCSEAIITASGAGSRRALSPGPFVWLLRGGLEPCYLSPTMLRTLWLALLALVSAAGPGQASGFTGEGSELGVGEAGGAGGSQGAGLVGTAALQRCVCFERRHQFHLAELSGNHRGDGVCVPLSRGGPGEFTCRF